MAVVGEAFVAIRPDTRGFQAEAARGVTGSVKSIAASAAATFAAVGVASFVKNSVGAALESNRVAAITEATIKATGKAAGITAKEISALSDAISKKTGVDDEAIQTGANQLLTFKAIRNEVGKGNDVFNRATLAAVDLAAHGFGSIDSASVMLGKALQDPIKGMTALTRVGVTFTEAQKEQVKTLVQAGDTLSAQKVILKAVEQQVGGTAEATATSSDKLKVAMGNLQEKLGMALLPTINAVVDALNRWLPTIEKLLPILVPLAAAIVTLVALTKAYTAVTTALNVVLGTTAVNAAASGTAMAGTNATMAGAAGPWGIAIAAGVGLGVVLHNLVETHLPGVNRKLEEVGGALYDFATNNNVAKESTAGLEAAERIYNLTGAKTFESIQKKINALREMAGNADGPTKAAIQNLIAKLEELQKDYKAKVTVEGVDFATVKVAALNAQLDRYESRGGRVKQGKAFQHGGYQPGPHNQAFPATLHGGEYVLSADIVDRIKRGQRSRGANMEMSAAGGDGARAWPALPSVGPITVQLVIDGKVFTAAIVDPMADALRKRDSALR